MLHDGVVSKLWPQGEPIGSNEYRDTQLLGSATARPFQSAFGQDIHGNIFEKGSALFHSLIANHPFYNGNKRTAILALDHFLLANGYFLSLSNDQMYALAKKTATYREQGMGHEEILQDLAAALEGGTIPLSKLKKVSGLTGYENVSKLRRTIRRHKLNREQPG